jgi:hypothetical protein
VGEIVVEEAGGALSSARGMKMVRIEQPTATDKIVRRKDAT